MVRNAFYPRINPNEPLFLTKDLLNRLGSGADQPL